MLGGCGDDEKLSEKEACGTYSDADGIAGWYYTPNSSRPELLTPWNDALYFDAYEERSAQRSLHRFDHGVASPIETEFAMGYLQAPLVPWRGELYAFEFQSGLWRIGPDDSVAHVVDLAWDYVWDELSSYTGAWPVVYGDELYFQAITSTGQMELTRFDGEALRIVADVDAGFPGGSYATQLTLLGESLYFLSTGRDGSTLWAYDGELLSLEQSLPLDDDGILLHPDTILGTREDRLVLWLEADDALVLYEPGGESVVVDTDVLSAVLVGTSIVYTKSDGIYRYDGVAPTFLGSFRADARREHQLRLTSGVEIAGHFYVTTTDPEYRDSFWLVEVLTESVSRLIVDAGIVAVHELSVFEEKLVLSAADDDGRHHRDSQESIVGHELFRFDPGLRTVELADDIRPGWRRICDRPD